jgi:hypothetical protein
VGWRRWGPEQVRGDRSLAQHWPSCIRASMVLPSSGPLPICLFLGFLIDNWTKKGNL